MNEVIDHIARLKAEQALDMINQHKKVCSDRYEDMAKFQAAIYDKLDDIKDHHFKQWLVVASGVITLLLTIVGLLFTKVMGWV